MIGRRFSPARWLARYEAAGGRFVIVGRGAVTLAPWTGSRAERLQSEILSNPAKWVAVYQLAAALGPNPEARR